MAALANLLAEALVLPPAERAELAGRLVRSLDEDAEDDPRAVEAAWTAEIEKRLREIDGGSVQLLSEEEAERVLMSDSADGR